MNLDPFIFVLEQLGQLLVGEIKFLSPEKKKPLEKLKEEVELAQCFARDVEEEKQHATITPGLENEVQHIMQILTQIEDFLDILYREEFQQSQQQNSCFPKFIACFDCTSNPLVHRHPVKDKVIQLTDDLRAVLQRAKPFQQQSNRPQVTHRRRRATQPHIIDDDSIVGLEKDVETLVAKLVGNDGEHETILAIIGMEGSGKTTLARKLYNHREIVTCYITAWACVSQEWDTPQILRTICESFHIPLPEDKSSIPYVKLLEFIQRNSCLVVLDDVWDMKALQELLPILLQEQKSSKGSVRVLVTSPNEKILDPILSTGVYIHRVCHLTREESWQLFSKIVHKTWQGIRSFDEESEFARLGTEMLEKCCGLPLAIIALAGLLSRKQTIQEWEALKSNVMSVIIRQNTGFYDYGPVKEMLELSYSNLPYDLKPCFLYLSIFPEDSPIYRYDLTRLWIGEGFLIANMCNEGQTLEELGRDFLDQLIQLCMVQVNSRDYEGEVDEIQIHDLMRDFCIVKASELGFFEISSQSMLHSTSSMKLMSRAIIHKGKSHLLCSSRLRSIIHLPADSENMLKLKLAYEKIKLLRVLHLEQVDLSDLGEQIGKLFLLRYLKIRKCCGVTNKLFESIKKLRSLLILILYEGNIAISNIMVDRMERLRHLDCKCTKVAVLGVKRLRNLQSLSLLAGEWLTKELNDDSLICSLQELELDGISSQEQLEVIYEFVSNPYNHLHILILTLGSRSNLEFDLQKMNLICCRLLRSLSLWGQIEKQPQPFLFPPNLLKLCLSESRIEKKEHMETALAQLDQLRHLQIKTDAYIGDKLTMSGLSQLQELQLEGLYNLKEWRIEKGALSQLQKLQILFCYELERIPEGISGIKTLKGFLAFGMPVSFCERLRRPSEKKDSGKGEGSGGGEHFHLVCHIPDIQIKDSKDHVYV